MEQKRNNPHHYRRHITTFSLIMISVSATIGSGWLFSPFYATRLAGPGAILAWILGSILVIFVALSYAETSSMLPITGGSARFPQLTHGTFVSLFFGWITWFNFVTAPATEVQALIQYSANYWPSLIRVEGQNPHILTLSGYTVAIGLMLFFAILNIYSVRLVANCNNIISAWKIIIPLMAAVILVSMSWHPGNFKDHGGFLANGWKGVFSALASGGIVFAFNGFKQGVELAGEAQNPSKAIVWGMLSGLLIALAIYLCLQMAFIIATPASDLNKGWLYLHFPGDAGPLAGFLMTLGISWAAVILYVDALIAPTAAGLVYTTSAARTLYGLSANKQIPAFLQEVTGRGIPVKAIMVNFVGGIFFLLFFNGWYAMAEFVSSIIALSYVTGPICCLTLRYQLPDFKRPFRVPCVHIWSFVGFYFSTAILYWTGWGVISKLVLCLLCSLLFFITYRFFSKRPREIQMHWQSAIWLWPYLVGLNLISYLGSYGGGLGIIPFGMDFFYLALLCLMSLFLAIRFRADDYRVQAIVKEFQREIQTGIPSTLPGEKRAHSTLLT